MARTTLYRKHDLTNYATTPTAEMDRYSRSDILKTMLPDSAEMETVSTGGYQGWMGFIIHLDGYVWLIKDGYGSCSYCDGLLAADNAASYGESMMRNVYCFDTGSDAATFVTEQDGYAWNEVADDILAHLNGDAR